MLDRAALQALKGARLGGESLDTVKFELVADLSHMLVTHNLSQCEYRSGQEYTSFKGALES